MPSLAWLHWRRLRARCSRLVEREPLRSHHRIDIKLGHAFDPHFVTKSCVEHDRHRAISERRAITVINIYLLPNSAIFKSYHGVALNAVNVAVHATNE